jgi:structural maintenance of chromosome 3 (chondroitin sulfate proteoglycan 6)
MLAITGVSKHFSDVFKELVPNGYGRMVMRTTADKQKKVTPEGESSEESEDEDEADNGPASQPMRVSEFVGIQIQVSFTGTGDRYLMQQLSGGQKALVALALIFSIQRCDPAPFYLFDEVDQVSGG